MSTFYFYIKCISFILPCVVFSDDEGSELVTKRGSEFKLPYPIIDLEPTDLGIAEMDMGSGGRGSDKSTRSKKSKSQLRDYMQASRKRKTPYRDVYADLNDYTLYTTSQKGYPYVDAATAIGDMSSADLMYSFSNYGLSGGTAAAAAAGDFYYSTYPAAAFATACAVYPSMPSHDAWYQREKGYATTGSGSSYYNSLSSHYQQLQQQYAGIYDVNSMTKLGYGRSKYSYDTSVNGYRYGLQKFLEANDQTSANRYRDVLTASTSPYGTAYDTSKLIGDCSTLDQLTLASNAAAYGVGSLGSEGSGGSVAVDALDMNGQRGSYGAYVSDMSRIHHTQLAQQQQQQQQQHKRPCDTDKNSEDVSVSSAVATSSSTTMGACYASVIKCVSPRLRQQHAQSPAHRTDDHCCSSSEAAAYPSPTRTPWSACLRTNRQQMETDASTAPHIQQQTFVSDSCALNSSSSKTGASRDAICTYNDYNATQCSEASTSTVGQTSVIHSLRSLRYITTAHTCTLTIAAIAPYNQT